VTVSIVHTWTGGYAPPGGFYFPRSATGPSQLTVANAAGDWMIAVAAWLQPLAGAGTSMALADDVHNWWEPVAADSPVAGQVRCSVWAAPAARAAGYVQAGPTAAATSNAVAVYDVSGIGPGWAPQAVSSNFSASGTSLALAGGTAAAQSIVISVFAAQEFGATITPPAGWTALTGSAIQAITNVPANITVAAAYQVITGAIPAATWSVSGSAVALAGVTVAVPLAAAVPAQASPNWPAVITEAAIGSGPLTPPSQLAWTDMSARALALQVQQGRQYSLSALQAAQGTLTLDNPDGALIPPGTGSFAEIDSGTPVRRRCYWPHGTTASTPWSVPFSGFFRRWPFTVPADIMRGQVTAEVSDIWAYATGSLNSMAREEMLLDQSYAVWPLADAAGATSGANVAPGNSAPLQLVTAKLGAGGATQEWGAGSGALIGDSSALVTGSGKGGGTGTYQLTLAGTSLNTQGYGYALTCYDPGFPQLAGNGLTVEAWFTSTSNQNTTGNGFINSGNTITVTGSSFANGTPVVFTSSGPALPTGMTGGQIYFVIAASGATFQISTAVGGSAVTLSSNSTGFCATTTPWNPVVLALRNAAGSVFSVQVAASTGNLFISGKSIATTTIDTSRDWRLITSLVHLSVALTATTWRVTLDGGAIGIVTGSMTSAPKWNELCLGGVMDRLSQGFCLWGQLALAAVYPYVLPSNRVTAHEYSAAAGVTGDPAAERIDRLLGYAGIAGRRWIGQLTVQYLQDTAPSGQDIGGQSAATGAGNIAASTVPALLYVAPCGDTVYQAKPYVWNNPIRWTLGDNTAGGEIPFSLAQFSTDYDPTRIYDDIQLSQLDTQSVTVPAGATASTTVAAILAAARVQYGDQPYQQTAYLQWDYNSAYTAGAGLVDLAAWIAMVYGRPRNRVPGVTVNAAAYPAAWPLFLNASTGDMVQVNLRLPTATASPLVSVIARVTQTQRSMKWATDETPVASITLTLDAAPEYNALTCDDSVRGLLNGSNVLPW
jgi:hypothetical protein